MTAKYARGAKIRINAKKGDGEFSYSLIREYNGMTGEVVSSVSVVAYLVDPGFGRHTPQTIEAYIIRLDAGVEVQNIVEDYLEAK